MTSVGLFGLILNLSSNYHKSGRIPWTSPGLVFKVSTPESLCAIRHYLLADFPELVDELLVLHLEEVVVEGDEAGEADLGPKL
jgi:hypothetical protein